MIPLIEHNFAPIDPEQFKSPRNAVFDEFFTNIGKTLRQIQAESNNVAKNSEFTRILVIEGFNVIIYYCGIGEFVICSINDLDDDKEKILDALQSLARRFHQKHRTDLQEFRYSNQINMFKPFKIDIINLSLKGTIGEEYPRLIVNKNTIDRLRKMSIITEEEYSIAEQCDGSKTPYKIAHLLDIDYDEIKRAMEKMKNLDIIEQKNLLALHMS